MKNKKILIISSVLVFCWASHCFAAAQETTPAYKLSIDDAIGVAFKNNKDIQIQEQEINAAQAVILGARSKFLPKLNANAGYNYVDSVLTLPPSFSTGMKKDIGIYTGYRNDNQVGLELSQNLFSGGANTANLRQQQVKLRIQEETLRARKLDCEFETKRLYYGLLLAYETQRIAQNLLTQAKSHYEDVKEKYGQGTTSRFDLLQSDVQVSRLMPELINAQNAVNLIDADLKKLLGLRMQDLVVLKDSFLYSPIEIKETEFLETAYLDKPEMTLMALGVDLNQWSIEMAKSEDRPQVNVHLGYNYNSNNIDDMINRRHNDWNAGISVSIPIFDGFSTKAKVDEAKVHYAQARLAKENLADQINVDIRRACLDLQNAQSVILSQKDSIEEAKEALKIAQVSYDNGEATNLDVMDAQVALSQVEKNLSEGIYDYLMAEAYLNRTMGTSSINSKGILNEETN